MNRGVKYMSILIILMVFAATATADPPTIDHVTHTEVTHNSVTITWDTTDEASDSLVTYMDGSGTYESPKDSTEVYLHTITLTGLSPDTTYAYKVSSTNTSSGNTSESAGTDSFKTLSAPDTTPPVISHVTNTTTVNSAIIIWTTDEESNSIVKYGTTSGTYSNNKPSMNMVTSHSIELTGLSANTTYYYVVNSTDGSGNSDESVEQDFTTDAESAGDTTRPTISDIRNTTTSDSATITWTTNEDSDSRVEYDTDSDAPPYGYNESSGTWRQDHSITLRDLEADTTYYFRVNSTDESGNSRESDQYTFKTKPSGHFTGNRIWDADEEMDLDYTWDARSFTGFYYDIDDDTSTETLTIHLEDYNDRNIDENDLEYITTAADIEFEYGDWGEYKVIGFMAEKYFAGYEEDNTSIASEDIRLVSKDMLSKVLIDEDEKHMISTGASLKLKEGYELKIIQLDVNGNQAQIELLKNGKSVDMDVVKSPDSYIYTKDLGKLDDVPLVVVHINSVFAGTESDMLTIDGIFQISDDVTTVDTGDDYGDMEIITSSGYTIKMENSDDIDLEEGEIVDIMGDLKFLVADSSTLRFALYEEITEPGTHDIRGTVYNTTEKPTWDHMNFEGFYYDIDDNLGTEELQVEQISGGTIEEGGLVYTTEPDPVGFDLSEWGSYEVIGFMAEKYFAGYDGDATDDEITHDDISLISKDMLSKVLIDVEDDRMISTGASLQLEEGYELKTIQLDVDGGQAQFELLKNGKSVDTDIVRSSDTYVYTKDLGKLDDVPIIAISIGSVFAGTETDMVTIDGAFQISDDPISIDTGDEYGEMEITSASSSGITMKNEESEIDLEGDETIMITEDIGFKVSEDEDRYFLFVRRTIGSPAALAIDFSETPVVDEEITITVTSDGDPVEGAAVTFNGENLGITDSNGEVTVTSEESGTFTVMASKEDYQSATEDLKILTAGEAEEDQLAIEMPGEVNPGDDVIIKVTSDGDPVEGASVKWDTEDIGETDETGSLTYTADEPGTYTIVASKSGYLDASEKITVSLPSAKFELSNFVLPEEVSAGKKFTVSVDVTNNGEVNGTYTAELSANGSVVDSKDIALDPDETGTVEFTHQVAEAGTCTIEIGTESGEIVVTKKAKSNTAAVVAILIVLALLGAIGYVLISSTPEGGWTIEKLIEAIKEKFQRKGL
ncbi:MAG: S-layer protein domain-containing protein [Candidatus Methanogasteraceae archaeon]